MAARQPPLDLSIERNGDVVILSNDLRLSSGLFIAPAASGQNACYMYQSRLLNYDAMREYGSEGISSLPGR